MKEERCITILELEILVKNAYNVGLCDGIEGGENPDFREFKNEDDFWEKNKDKWLKGEINLIN